MFRRIRLSCPSFVAAPILSIGAFAAYAQDHIVERQLKAVPAHGSVTVKHGTLKATNIKQCLAIELPAFVAFYHASADYSGADDFELEIGLPNGHKRRERIHGTVTTSSSGTGEGIRYQS
jgi:hypothetical protein